MTSSKRAPGSLKPGGVSARTEVRGSGGGRSHDVVIVGAGPAGAAAAVTLAQTGRRVALIDAAKFPRKALCAGWLSAKALPILESLGVSLDDIDGRPFKAVTFYNADFTKSAVPVFGDTPGFFVDRARLDEQLVSLAVKSGATFSDATRVVDVTPGESSVAVMVEKGDPVVGSLLVLAAGRGTPLIERLRLAIGGPQEGWWAAQVEMEDLNAEQPPSVAIILGLDDFGGFGIVSRAGGHVTVGVHTPGDKSSVVATLTGLCKNVVNAGLIDAGGATAPRDLVHRAARATPVMTPAAVALAMDTHTAKRTLIVGDAGGFVSATSGEGIYPAMWSARIAAGVIDDALSSPSPQDVLMQFDTRWRTEMADYLRPPNTDPQYILPLVFSNQPVADRMGAAFFSGENI